MALIKLRMANESGEEVGELYLNTDQLVSVSKGQSTTEVQMANGHTFWVKDPIEQVAVLAKSG
jgi:hypothetical protein